MMDRPIVQPWWGTSRAKTIWIGGSILLFLLLAGLMLHGAAERNLRVPHASVIVSTVQRGAFHDFVPLHGTVVPKDTIYLDALAGGQVEKIFAQAGDEVAKGQPLILFHNAQLELDVLNNAGRLVESITQVQAFETQLENNRVSNEKTLADIRYNITTLEHTAARYDPLLKAQAIAQKQVEEVHDQLDHYRALLPLQMQTNKRQEALRRKEMPGLEAELASLQKSLAATHAQLDELTVRAPVSGRITQLDLKIGENRNRGERLAEITPHTGYKIAADIDEYYLDRVRVGQNANIVLNGEVRNLQVARVYPEVKNGIFTIDLTFDGQMPHNLSPGATVDGKLALGSDRAALILPTGAFLEASGGDYVFVLNAGGNSAHRRRVKLGRRNSEQVEILSGLEPGDQVITSSYATYDAIDRLDLTG